MKKVNISSWIILDKQKRILLIKRKYNVRELPNYWSIPWWHQDEWETREEVAIREVKEEVWLDFHIKELFIEDVMIVKEWERENHFCRYLWDASWKLKIQEEECDWYGWFGYEETKGVLIYKNMREIIEKLYDKDLLS